MDENVIEFLKGQERATLTLSQGRFITKITDLSKKYPDECDCKKNDDGSVIAHVPVTWLHISRIKRKLSEEQKAELKERARHLYTK